MNYDELTETQQENLEEFLKVTVICDEEQLAAMDHQIPMTRELFERCLDSLISIHAVQQIERLLEEFPEWADPCEGCMDCIAEKRR